MDDEAVAEPVQVAVEGGQQRPAFDDPRVPWAGKPGRADILCWAGITLSGIFYWVMLPFRASLVGTHPVLLVLLNGSTEGIVSAAAFARIGHGTLVVVLLAALVGLVKFDPLFWWRAGCGASGSSPCWAVGVTAGPSTWAACTAGAASSPGRP